MQNLNLNRYSFQSKNELSYLYLSKFLINKKKQI